MNKDIAFRVGQVLFQCGSNMKLVTKTVAKINCFLEQTNNDMQSNQIDIIRRLPFKKSRIQSTNNEYGSQSSIRAGWCMLQMFGNKTDILSNIQLLILYFVLYIWLDILLI